MILRFHAQWFNILKCHSKVSLYLPAKTTMHIVFVIKDAGCRQQMTGSLTSAVVVNVIKKKNGGHCIIAPVN